MAVRDIYDETRGYKDCDDCENLEMDGICIDQCPEHDHGVNFKPKKVLKFKGEGGSHYKENRIVETYLLMEQVATNIFVETSDIKKALWTAIAMKHLDRVGTKNNDVDGELLKAENYIHRARTGEWIDKEDK